jgi:hypothetical protein
MLLSMKVVSVRKGRVRPRARWKAAVRPVATSPCCRMRRSFVSRRATGMRRRRGLRHSYLGLGGQEMRMQLVVWLIDDVQQGGDDASLKLRPGAIQHLLARLGDGERSPVGTV